MTLADQTATGRSPANDRDGAQTASPTDQQAPHVNVGGSERKISTAAGAALVLLGLSRRSIPGLALAGLGGAMIYRGVSGHCPLYESLGVDTRDAAPDPQEYFDRGIHVEHAVTILKPREELFQFWRNFENLPRFMQHLESVKVLDGGKSHWVAKGPAGSRVQWDAEIINEEPGTLIAWRSLAGADVDSTGSVRFVDAPAGRGTEVRVVMDYIPPAGRVGKYVAMLFGEEPRQQLQEDMRHFKQIMECGEVLTTEGQPRGTCR